MRTSFPLECIQDPNLNIIQCPVHLTAQNSSPKEKRTKEITLHSNSYMNEENWFTGTKRKTLNHSWFQNSFIYLFIYIHDTSSKEQSYIANIHLHHSPFLVSRKMEFYYLCNILARHYIHWQAFIYNLITITCSLQICKQNVAYATKSKPSNLVSL